MPLHSSENLHQGDTMQTQRPEVFNKKVFLKYLQNSQENTYAGVSFLIKLQVSLWIRNSTGVFWCGFLEILKNTFFAEHLQKTASDHEPGANTCDYSHCYEKIRAMKLITLVDMLEWQISEWWSNVRKSFDIYHSAWSLWHMNSKKRRWSFVIFFSVFSYCTQNGMI